MSERDTVQRIVFFGTPQFAVPTLDALEAAGRNPVVVVTQPSRESGRGRKTVAPPVLRWAQERGVETMQPKSVKSSEFRDQLHRIAPDLAVVVAFGQIFPQSLLDIPRLGCMNLHASLLPRHRGASPISAAIAAGDTVTGVSTMWMEAGLDSGPVLLQRSLAIGDRETTGELAPKLARLGGDLVVETIDAFERGDLEPRPQDSALATYAPQLDKSDGVLDWSSEATVISHRVRAHEPWPGTWTEFRSRPLRIRRARVAPPGSLESDADACEEGPGVLLGRRGGALAVAAGGGTVLLVESLQRPGRRVISAVDFANAEAPKIGERFGFAAAPAEPESVPGDELRRGREKP